MRLGKSSVSFTRREMKGFLLAIGAIVFMLITMVVTIAVKKPRPVIQQCDVKPKVLTNQERMNELVLSFRKYKTMTQQERHMHWLYKFADAKYKRNGKIKFDEFDCSTAVWYWLDSLGSNWKMENTQGLQKTLKEKKAKKRWYYSSAKSGDIIILKVKGAWHCGLVDDVKRNYIMYMDVNLQLGGMGWHIIRWGDRRIVGIYEINFPFWAGGMIK